MKKSNVGKSVYCFGAGKYFAEFVTNNSDLCIDGVVDNYPGDRKCIEINKHSIPIIPFGEYKKTDNVQIIITSLYAESILEQVLSDERFCNAEIEIMPSVLRRLGTTQKELLGKIRNEVDSRNHAEPAILGRHVQISEMFPDAPIAGSKALQDVTHIAEELGYRRLSVNLTAEVEDEKTSWRFEQSAHDYRKVYDAVGNDAIVVVQHPFRYPDLARERCILKLKNEKNAKIIAVVHDAEIIRNQYMSPYLKHEFDNMLCTADVLIVHNEVMKNYFVSLGIEESRLVSLDLFDYICEKRKDEDSNFIERPIVYAGNLTLDKSPFLGKLSELNDIPFYLYGPNYDENKIGGVNVFYQGVYSSSEVPSRLAKGYGLVWDGTSIDTCEGDTGNYLRYNNPHKLSLYLAAGIPVVIWREAACAKFVEANHVGILVDSLRELTNIIREVGEDKYRVYEENAVALSKKLRDGYFLKRAILEAENRLRE